MYPPYMRQSNQPLFFAARFLHIPFFEEAALSDVVKFHHKNVVILSAGCFAISLKICAASVTDDQIAVGCHHTIITRIRSGFIAVLQPALKGQGSYARAGFSCHRAASLRLPWSGRWARLPPVAAFGASDTDCDKFHICLLNAGDTSRRPGGWIYGARWSL